MRILVSPGPPSWNYFLRGLYSRRAIVARRLEVSSGSLGFRQVIRLLFCSLAFYPHSCPSQFSFLFLTRNHANCRYCDTITGDWLIDYHPEYSNLVVASGDSGHGFKFAPIIGREILKVIERNTSPEYAVRWSWAGDLASGADTRMGERKELRIEDLVTPDDLRGEIAAKL